MSGLNICRDFSKFKNCCEHLPIFWWICVVPRGRYFCSHMLSIILFRSKVRRVDRKTVCFPIHPGRAATNKNRGNHNDPTSIPKRFARSRTFFVRIFSGSRLIFARQDSFLSLVEGCLPQGVVIPTNLGTI